MTMVNEIRDAVKSLKKDQLLVLVGELLTLEEEKNQGIQAVCQISEDYGRRLEVARECYRDQKGRLDLARAIYREQQARITALETALAIACGNNQNKVKAVKGQAFVKLNDKARNLLYLGQIRTGKAITKPAANNQPARREAVVETPIIVGDDVWKRNTRLVYGKDQTVPLTEVMCEVCGEVLPADVANYCHRTLGDRYACRKHQTEVKAADKKVVGGESLATNEQVITTTDDVVVEVLVGVAIDEDIVL